MVAPTASYAQQIFFIVGSSTQLSKPILACLFSFLSGFLVTLHQGKSNTELHMALGYLPGTKKREPVSHFDLRTVLRRCPKAI